MDYTGKLYIKSLNGLKGILALIVMFGHYKAAFPFVITIKIPDFLKSYLSLDRITGPESWNWVIGNGGGVLYRSDILTYFPFGNLFNGGFAVYIFWTISAFIISVFWNTKKDKTIIITQALNKYLKMIFPITCSVILAYLLLKLGLYFNAQADMYMTHRDYFAEAYSFQPHFIEAVKQAVFGCFWGRTPTYNLPLWTMHMELWGSWFTVCLLVLLDGFPKKYLFYILLSILAIRYNSSYLCFLGGAVIGNCYCDVKFKCGDTVGWCMFFVGFVLGGYNLIYRLPNYMPETVRGIEIRGVLYAMGAALILFGVVFNKKLNAFFSNKFLLWLGSLSVYIYLFHFPIMYSLFSFLFVKFQQSFNHYTYSVLGAMFLTAVATILFTMIYKYLFEDKLKKYCKRFNNYLLS